MNKIAYTLSTLCAVAAPALAGEMYTDRAKVLAANPISERIPVSREQCWNEKVRSYEERRVTRTDTGAAIGPGTVLGAIVGGVAGHQVGSGRGNDAATAAGAVIGGLVGNQVDRSNGATTTHVERVPVDRNVERCRTVQEVREARVGYDVRYVYNGREFSTRMDRDPGRSLEVAVKIEPREGREIPPRGHRPPPPTYR